MNCPVSNQPCDRDEICDDDYCNRKDRGDISGLAAHTNIAAFTAMSGYSYYPAFVSINRVEPKHGSDVEIMVRAPESSPGVCGPEATIRMTDAEFRSLLNAAQKYLPILMER